MAVVAVTFEGRSAVAPRSLGLSLRDQEELRSYFRWHASEVGLRSAYGAWVSVLSGAGGYTDPEDIHERMLRLVWGNDVIDASRAPMARANRIRRTLQLMDADGLGRFVSVLFLAFGEGPAWSIPLVKEFGADVAPILHLTDAVADVRERLALREGEARYDRISEAYPRSRDEGRAAIENDFWDAAGMVTRLESRIADRGARVRCDTAKGRAITADLARQCVAWRSVLERLLRAYEYDGTASAQATAMGSADHEISVVDALHHALRHRGAKVDPDSQAAHRQARAEFVGVAKAQARRLLVQAAQAYVDAKSRVTS